jgi:ABC-type antimicrobial peptide transport system permease subunit
VRAATLLALVIALPAGILSVVRRTSAADVAGTLLALSGVSMPNFWLAILMIFLFSVTLGWLPPPGWVSPARDFWGGVRSIVLRHIVPATLAAIIVHASLRVAFAVLAEAGLSFLGLGTQPPTPSWGAVLSSGREYLEMAPWLAIAPGAAIFVTTLGFNFLGDGLRDAADPRLRA